MKWFKLVLIVCLALLIVGPGIAQAQRGSRETLDYAYAKVASRSNDGSLTSYPTYVFAVTVYPDPASTSLAFVEIYDDTEAPAGGNETVAIELSETTQYATNRIVYDPPILLEYGAYADVTNCSVVLEYR